MTAVGRRRNGLWYKIIAVGCVREMVQRGNTAFVDSVKNAVDRFVKPIQMPEGA